MSLYFGQSIPVEGKDPPVGEVSRCLTSLVNHLQWGEKDPLGGEDGLVSVGLSITLLQLG